MWSMRFQNFTSLWSAVNRQQGYSPGAKHQQVNRCRHTHTSKETHLSPQNLIGWCDDARRLMFPYVMSHRQIILRTSILHFCLFSCMRPFDRCQFIDFRIKEKKRRDIQVWILFASHLQTEYISAELWMWKNQYVLFIGLLWTDHLL